MKILALALGGLLLAGGGVGAAVHLSGGCPLGLCESEGSAPSAVSLEGDCCADKALAADAGAMSGPAASMSATGGVETECSESDVPACCRMKCEEVGEDEACDMDPSECEEICPDRQCDAPEAPAPKPQD